MRGEEQREEGFLLDDGAAGSFGVEKTVGKFLIPHNLPEFIFGEQRSERGGEAVGEEEGDRRGTASLCSG